MSGNLVQYKKGEDGSADKLVELVNKEIANFNVLYTKLHNYHWNVNGPHFFSLHVKLEELYNEVTLNMDELAERLLALGAKPVATIKEYMELTTIKEATGSEKTETMVKNIISDFETLSDEFAEIISIAEENSDEVTGDMLVGMKKSLNKHTWMLRAYLGK
ncbi:DNA starvation/stationary phase protection protein [Peribacillus psychrosaccharolyticus]|uniref:DNA starvation/stationary phase protection protein n=1 Tax=Peribacillus psychrosaccharolyticus TaxID=1407 RepID=A0A974NKG6_PERPY|nr:Dps family protein [Peribacillus psychrosaccharolyticus]MEC2054831.1 DNA starvation/stationary phase protection protein [Peribacillus psychrosaccharolyticus]MED3743943.1 DNA starvation/stationary phase protection protein [Peribacillus psychrosaccharolyticus]QQS99448.1 DNA starvation/stationary phase protection protein [Peribacillus psychrosaccharolyticus]